MKLTDFSKGRMLFIVIGAVISSVIYICVHLIQEHKNSSTAKPATFEYSHSKDQSDLNTNRWKTRVESTYKYFPQKSSSESSKKK